MIILSETTHSGKLKIIVQLNPKNIHINRTLKYFYTVIQIILMNNRTRAREQEGYIVIIRKK